MDTNRKEWVASAAAAARRVGRCARLRRREDGFDQSGPEKGWGEYSPYKGGSYYFNANQDRHVAHVLDRYSLNKESDAQTEDDSGGLYKASRGRAQSLAEDIRDTMQRDSDHLLLTVARLLLTESCMITDQPTPDSEYHNEKPKRKYATSVPAQRNSKRPLSAWKGRGRRKSVSSSSMLSGSMSSITTSSSHSLEKEDTPKKKLSFRSTASDAVSGSGGIAMAGDARAERDHTPSNSRSLLESGIPPRPPPPLPPPSRQSAEALSTPRSRRPDRYSGTLASYTYPPVMPTPPHSLLGHRNINSLHSTALHRSTSVTANTLQEVGTNTDVETRSTGTQTLVDQDTQTELSYLMGKKLPLLLPSKTNTPARDQASQLPPTPPKNAKSSTVQVTKQPSAHDDTTPPTTVTTGDIGVTTTVKANVNENKEEKEEVREEEEEEEEEKEEDKEEEKREDEEKEEEKEREKEEESKKVDKGELIEDQSMKEEENELKEAKEDEEKEVAVEKEDEEEEKEVAEEKGDEEENSKAQKQEEQKADEEEAGAVATVIKEDDDKESKETETDKKVEKEEEEEQVKEQDKDDNENQVEEEDKSSKEKQEENVKEVVAEDEAAETNAAQKESKEAAEPEEASYRSTLSASASNTQPAAEQEHTNTPTSPPPPLPPPRPVPTPPPRDEEESVTAEYVKIIHGPANTAAVEPDKQDDFWKSD